MLECLHAVNTIKKFCNYFNKGNEYFKLLLHLIIKKRLSGSHRLMLTCVTN